MTDAAGHEVPAQVAEGKVLFVARVPSVGFAVFHLTAVPRQAQGFGPAGELKVTANTLENKHYRVTVNAAGDVASVFDKGLGKELLAAPMRLAISDDNPKQWPAWNMDFDQEQAAPRAYVSGPVQMRIAESGPARVAIEVTRQTEGSTFVQTVSLSAGAAGRAGGVWQQDRLAGEEFESEGRICADGGEWGGDVLVGCGDGAAAERGAAAV